MTVGAEAQDRGQDRGQDSNGVYQLGEIYVAGATRGTGSGSGGGVGGSTVTREQMWTFEKQTLDQAVNLVPGVNGTLSSAGQRNETDISCADLAAGRYRL